MATKIADGVWERMHPSIRQLGQDRLQKLKSVRHSIQKLNDALSGFTYRPDKINLMEHPEMTCLTRRGDCDASARLLQAVYEGRGTIWAIIKKAISDDSAGHLVYQDDQGGIWSNFGYVGMRDIEAVADGYVKGWKAIVEILPGVYIGRIIEK